jgi:hypothetical protein
LTAVGDVFSPVSGGQGRIDAYLYGLDVFSLIVNTCGQDQSVDVLGVATGTLNALACPVSQGKSNANISFSIGIPNEAAGLGSLAIIVNGTQQVGAPAYCLNLSISL